MLLEPSLGSWRLHSTECALFGSSVERFADTVSLNMVGTACFIRLPFCLTMIDSKWSLQNKMLTLHWLNGLPSIYSFDFIIHFLLRWSSFGQLKNDKWGDLWLLFEQPIAEHTTILVHKYPEKNAHMMSVESKITYWTLRSIYLVMWFSPRGVQHLAFLKISCIFPCHFSMSFVWNLFIYWTPNIKFIDSHEGNSCNSFDVKCDRCKSPC